MPSDDTRRGLIRAMPGEKNSNTIDPATISPPRTLCFNVLKAMVRPVKSTRASRRE